MSTAPDIDLRFRRAERADALCIGVLGMQVFLDTYATEGVRPALANEALQSFATQVIEDAIEAPGNTFIVAEAHRHMLGFAQLTKRANHALVAAPDSSQLNRLYVQERFTGRGLGRALLAQAEAAARVGGASTLWLTAWVGNARALRFYARCGYQRLGSTLFEFQGEGYENFLFAKTLQSASDC